MKNYSVWIFDKIIESDIRGYDVETIELHLTWEYFAKVIRNKTLDSVEKSMIDVYHFTGLFEPPTEDSSTKLKRPAWDTILIKSKVLDFIKEIFSLLPYDGYEKKICTWGDFEDYLEDEKNANISSISELDELHFKLLLCKDDKSEFTQDEVLNIQKQVTQLLTNYLEKYIAENEEFIRDAVEKQQRITNRKTKAANADKIGVKEYLLVGDFNKPIKVVDTEEEAEESGYRYFKILNNGEIVNGKRI